MGVAGHNAGVCSVVCPAGAAETERGGVEEAEVLEVVRPLWERCDRLRLPLPDGNGFARLSVHSRDDLARGVAHVVRQMAAGKVTKPFGLLISMLDRGALPGDGPPPKQPTNQTPPTPPSQTALTTSPTSPTSAMSATSSASTPSQAANPARNPMSGGTVPSMETVPMGNGVGNVVDVVRSSSALFVSPVDDWPDEQVVEFVAARGESSPAGVRLRSMPALRAAARHYVAVDAGAVMAAAPDAGGLC